MLIPSNYFMKKIFFLLFLGFYPIFLLAQKEDSSTTKNVAFTIIDQPPIYPGCEKLGKNLQKLCLQNQIKKFVNKNFNIGIAAKLGLKPGIKRVYVQFTINKHGAIRNVKAKGPHKELEKEGVRVIKLLPKMVSGKLKGKSVGVNYTIPITLLIE